MKSKNFSTVTELTFKIKDLLENNFFNVFVKGEISNFIHHGSGHMYFTLKDRNSEISLLQNPFNFFEYSKYELFSWLSILEQLIKIILLLVSGKKVKL